MNFNIKKKFGQNFIKNQNLLKQIVDNITINEDDLVIEIGPGQGDLTKQIIKNNCFYIGYEIDKELSPFLNSVSNNKQQIIYEDFLQANIINMIKDINYKKMYIIANLPYYITTPIIKKIVDDKLPIHEMLLMVQKEVGDRFCSSPKSKDYGSLTVYLNCFFSIKKIIDVKKENFYPKPKVDSVVLKFTIKPSLLNENNIDKFNKLLRDSFQHKRKIIKNNLQEYDLKKIEQILLKNKLSLQSRPEEIPVEVYIKILQKL